MRAFSVKNQDFHSIPCLANHLHPERLFVPKITVLLGDEYQICLAGLSKLLADDFDVIGSAQDGMDLLRAAAELHPAVIVTDVLARFRDGEDAVQQIQDKNPAAKIVILTHQRDAWSARRTLKAGASAYILKRDQPGELIAAIFAAARGESGIISPSLARPAEVAEIQRLGILTPRQTQVLRLLAEGRTQKEIAAIIDVSTRTVEFHKYELMRRLGVRSSAELMAIAARHGLIDTEQPNLDFYPSKI